MAVGIAISKNEGVQYNGKITWCVFLSSIAAATGGLIFGYDNGVTGGVTSMEPFLEKFFPGVYIKMKEDKEISNYCKFDSQLLTTFTSSLYIAGLIASFFASPVTRALGRRASIVIGGASFLAGAALGAAAHNVYINGTPKYRGAFNIGFQFCVSTGVLSAFLVNYATQKIRGGWGWANIPRHGRGPASILTVGGLFLPDTPNSLIQRGHPDDHARAKKMLRKIRGTGRRRGRVRRPRGGQPCGQNRQTPLSGRF
ncbi:hexose carrier protein hex6 [Phtheirospermum japonicum]|uniref:Hexose carrier protein hex6 n=1 Tax=Phtheirospermum japonicum TaxID=374723 RepID=A0A830D3F9_9LAMI|nr:hexose carrier protein hex6 [Phtheirospermum japonicum]